MKGRFIKKLKSFPTLNSLKNGLLQPSNSFEKYSENPPLNKEYFDPSLKNEETESELRLVDKRTLGNFLNIPVLLESECDEHDQAASLSETDASIGSKSISFLPDPSSKTLFDPRPIGVHEKQSLKISSTNQAVDDDGDFASLKDFEELCPPDGNEVVILYITSLRGIRKTFEDCNSIRFLLKSFRILFYERDVSMHLEFKEELRRIMGGRIVLPRLFIKGRHIGGADEVIGMHEQGKLRKLLEGIPIDPSSGRPCSGCAGVWFVVCSNCSGSRKVVASAETGVDLFTKCLQCNENGLIKCPVCC
ncbi:Glutaredoxin [Dillenia turbinata]|uniref:Glutaredoxin n=1 Tax=Dillenia turbinata TaxID=194707 RepID=A0AAN8W6I6_9MAGN